MKTITKKIFALLTVISLIFVMSACGSGSSAETEAAPETVTEAAQEEAEEQVFTYTEDNGSVWTIYLEGSGTFTLSELNGISGETTKHSGALWTDNGDGTFTTGEWYDPDSDKSDFFEYDGTCTWIDNGDGTVTPANEGGSSGDGISAGKYIYDEDCGDFIITWAVCLNGDGTFQLEETHGLSGETNIYTGDSWTDNGDGTATTGAWNEEGNVSDFMETDGTATWKINADGTCEPAGEGEGEGDDGSISPGKYVYDEDCGDFIIEWAVGLNGNGSFQIEETHGLSGETNTYTGDSWTDNGDGTATTGAWNEEGDVSDFMEADGTATWKINADGTCEPAE